LPGGFHFFADSLALLLLLLLRMTTVVAANANAKQELSAEFKGRGGEEWGAKSAFSVSPFCMAASTMSHHSRMEVEEEAFFPYTPNSASISRVRY